MALWLKWEDTDAEEFAADYVHTWQRGQAPERTEEIYSHVLSVRRTMLLAEPFFVTAEMCDLVETAVATFRPEAFHASDFLSPAGFVYFEKPVEMWLGSDGDEVKTPYKAFTWHGVAPPDHEPGGPPMGTIFSTYIDWAKLKDETDPSFELPHILEFESAEFDKPFGRPNQWHELGWWRLAQTTLRLMLEFKPVSRYDAKLDRAARKAAGRVGFDARDVTVVRLRRRKGEREPLGGTADYSCRFLVSGHWRNQWCPSVGHHRQTWIAPYVKGPDDKPFRPTRGRAFVFHR